jgi:hypothetical protein
VIVYLNHRSNEAAIQNIEVMELPAILTANTYFWNPAGSAQQRRNNETRRLLEVQDFLSAIGFAWDAKNGERSGKAKRLP